MLYKLKYFFNVLVEVIHKLADKGNTVIVIEHNLDLIKAADWVIDIGPEGGRFGGEIVAQGTPIEVTKNFNSPTSQYLKKEFERVQTFSSQ